MYWFEFLENMWDSQSLYPIHGDSTQEGWAAKFARTTPPASTISVASQFEDRPASCVSNGNDTACHTSVRSALIHLRLRLQMSAEILEKCTTFEKLTNRAYQNMYNFRNKLPPAKCVGIALLQMHAPELSLKLNACLTSIKIYINYCLIY